ncbi:unnamed protein product [Rodentolepis nana]|uniref:TACC_C domain-containing protein n=1 Tax=Rodentolepis nana TaxID=102285 RepID=A0A158QHG1_RODNA|nr:unnamed protein product [Rodentolepis nana]
MSQVVPKLIVLPVTSTTAFKGYGTINLLKARLSELEEQESAHDVLEDTSDLQVNVTSILQLVSSNGWNLSIIPEHSPLLTFIPFIYQEALTISNATNSYQTNVPVHADLTPTNLCPRIIASNYVDISTLVKSNPLIFGIDKAIFGEKLRHLSSSSSSRTSEACYLSAEEDTSLNDDLFYDPMRMELANSFDQNLESTLKHEVEEGMLRLELQPKMEPLSYEHNIGLNEARMLHHTTDGKELQNIDYSDEKVQTGASEISSGFERSIESLLLTEDSVGTESCRRPSVRFNDTEEIIVFGDDYSDCKTSNDGSVVDDEIVEETLVDSNMASQPTKDLKTETGQTSGDTLEGDSELPEKVSEYRENLNSEIIQKSIESTQGDTQIVGSNEQVPKLEETQEKGSSKSGYDQKQLCFNLGAVQLPDSLLECSQENTKKADICLSPIVEESQIQGQISIENTANRIAQDDVNPKEVELKCKQILGKTVESDTSGEGISPQEESSKNQIPVDSEMIEEIIQKNSESVQSDSQNAGSSEQILELEETLREKGASKSEYDQKPLCFNLGSVQLPDSLLECAQENTKKLDICLSPIVEESQLRDQVSIDGTVNRKAQGYVSSREDRPESQQVPERTLKSDMTVEDISSQEETSNKRIPVDSELIEETIQKNAESVQADSHDAGSCEQVPELEESLEKGVSKSEYDQKSLRFNLGFVQLPDSLLECAQENTKKPDICLSPTVEESKFQDQVSIDETANRILRDDVNPIDVTPEYQQVQDMSLKSEVADNILPSQEKSSKNQIPEDSELIEETIQRNTESVQADSHFAGSCKQVPEFEDLLRVKGATKSEYEQKPLCFDLGFVQLPDSLLECAQENTKKLDICLSPIVEESQLQDQISIDDAADRMAQDYVSPREDRPETQQVPERTLKSDTTVEDISSQEETSNKQIPVDSELIEETIQKNAESVQADSHVVGSCEQVPELEESLEKGVSKSEYDQKPLCFNLGSVQLPDSLLESAQENTKKPDICLSPTVEESMFQDQVSIDDTANRMLQKDVNPKEVTHEHEQILGKTVESDTTGEGISPQEESSEEQPPLVSEMVEETIQKNTESLSNAPVVNMGAENEHEIINESSSEFNTNLISSVDLKSQLEPLKHQGLVEMAETVPNFQMSSISCEASFLSSEQKQAGSFETPSAFDTIEESTILPRGEEHLDQGYAGNDESGVAADVGQFIEDNTDTLQQPELSAQCLFYGTERTHENASELTEELPSNEASNIELPSQREPMKDQIQIGKSVSNVHFDDKLIYYEGDMKVSEGQQAGISEISSAFDNTKDVTQSTDMNIEPAVNKSEAFGDIQAVPIDSALKPSFSDPKIIGYQQAGSSEVVPGFSEEVIESKSNDVVESTDSLEGNLHCGIEQKMETEFENFVDMNIKEELNEKLQLEMQSIDYKIIAEAEVSVQQCDGPSTENRRPSLYDSKQAGASEMSAMFCEVDAFNAVSNVAVKNFGIANQADTLDLKTAQNEVSIHAETEISQTVETVLNTEFSKGNESQSQNAEAALTLQSPLFPQDLDTECVKDIDTTDCSAVNLQVATHPTSDLLPQQIELHPLEQFFNLLDKNTNFNERGVKGSLVSTDGKLTTLPAEIVTTNEAQLERGHGSVQNLSQQVATTIMSEVRRHSIQLRRLSSHFSLNIDAFDTSRSLFDTWSERDKPERRRYYASFDVEADKRRETSPELMSVEEDEVVERLDADNPDRWVVEAAAPYRSGRLAAVCLLEKPVASHYRLSTNKNPREKFREEVLTISNKQHECLMKRRHALTDLAEEEEGYQFRIKTLRNFLKRLEGTQFENDNKVPLPEEMVKATKGMLAHIDNILELSESSLLKFQACIVDPLQAANCFTQNESQWAEYSAYLYYLNQWMQSFKNLISGDKLNNVFCLTPENDGEEGRIYAQHLLEYLFAPKTHLSAYEHLLSSMARYSSRASQDTRGLEEAITVLKQIQRRTSEALKLWPYVSNMPVNGSLGVLPNEDEDFAANSLPQTIIRMTLLKVGNQNAEENLVENTQEGFLLLDRNSLLFIQKVPDDQKKHEILWKLPLENVRLRTDGMEMDTANFELWDISYPEEQIKCVYTIIPTSPVNQLAWIQDIERAMKDKGIVDTIVDEALVKAHQAAVEEVNGRRVSTVDDIPAEAIDVVNEAYYDVDEMTKSKNVDSEAAQQARAGDDESSLTYYSAEGSIMQLPKQDKPRPDSMLSIDSVNTLDGVTNPFMEQIPEQDVNTIERTEVVHGQKLLPGEQFVHNSEVQKIDSSEGGEMELTIETSTSDDDAYTTEWTFNGVPVDSEKMGSYPRIEGNAVYLFVPKVSRELHEGRYECTLSWPSGMKAIFPFEVTVHEPEEDFEPTNEINKLKLKTVEVSKIPVATESEEGSIDYQEVQINGEPSKDVASKENVKPILVDAEEPLTRYRASKSSIIAIEDEVSVNNAPPNETTDVSTKQEKISSSEVPKVSGESTTSTQPLIQEYMEPIKLKTVEGDPFRITATGRVDSSAAIVWTLDGRKIPANAFEIQRKHSAVELTKPKFVESDSGEYTLWVDGKVKANFLLTVEKPKEEPKSKDDTELLPKKTEVPCEEVEKVVEEKVETSQEETPKISPKESKESSPKGEDLAKVAVQLTNLQLFENDDFKLLATIPINARQLKSDRLWWTKNGKSFIDVDGVAIRSAKFMSRSSNKSPKSTDVDLVKKETVTPEDAATYVLMGEPRVKRGFKNQETVYATIIVSVIEKTKQEPEKLENEPEIETNAEPEPAKEIPEVEPATDEIELKKKKKSRDEMVEEKPKKKKSIVDSSKEKGRKEFGDEETEVKPKKKKSTDETEKEKSKEKKDWDENAQETPGKRKSSINEVQKVPEEAKRQEKAEATPNEVVEKELSPKKEEEEKVNKSESPKAGTVPTAATAENIIKLKEGEKFELKASVPIDSRQMKSDRLWWTKNGKVLMDVDGISPRGSDFKSKSTTKSPKLTDIELVKKAPTSIEDAGTYKLMGEPRIKRGFKSQETTYISFVVSVEEQPRDELSEPLVEEEKLKPQDVSKEEMKTDTKEQMPKEEEMYPKAEEKVEEVPSKLTDEEAKRKESIATSDTVNLTEGDKFQLTATIPLDSRQLKNNKLWWTKNGKSFIDVDGIAPRTAKFTSKSTSLLPSTSKVELIKKDPAGIDDAATYVLIGEPRVKRGFKNQETTYATIVVAVAEKPKEVPEKVQPEVPEVQRVESRLEAETTNATSETERPQGEEREKEVKPKKKKSRDETSEVKPKKKKSIDESSEGKPKKKKKKSIDETKPSKEEDKRNEESLPVTEMPKEDAKTDLPDGGRAINLTIGDKLELLTEIPLDAPQLKNEKLWWTKDGKPLSDVDGVTARSAQFAAKSTPKPPKSTDVALIKKDPAAPEDSGTYVLRGEPKIKRGLKSQETIYATIVLEVWDKETAEAPEEVMKEELEEVPEPSKTEDEIKPEETGSNELETKIPASGEGDEKKEKRKKKKSLEGGDGEEKKKSKKRKKGGDGEEEAKPTPSEGAVEPTKESETKPIENIELRCIEANANRRLGHDKVPIPAGEPLCLTITGIPPDVASVEWTLNGQPVRSGKHVQRLLEPNPLGKRYDGELMAQLYLDSTVLLDSGDYELSIKPTDGCPVSANLKIPVEIIPARKDPAKSRARAENQSKVPGVEEEDNVLQVQPNLCQPLGFAACEGQPLSLIADLNVPPDQVPPESVSWSRNGVPLSRDDPANDFRIEPSDQNRGHTSVILYKPAVTLDDVGFYSVAYNPLPAIQEEPLAEEEDEEGYGVAWEVDFPELLVFPDEKPKQAAPPVFTKELPTEIRVSEGDTITLDAEIAEPIPGITPIWSVNGHTIEPTRTSEYVVWDSGNYFALTIPAASRHQLGEYKLKLISDSSTATPLSTSCRLRGKADFESTQFDTSKRAVSVVDGIAPMFTRKLADVDCYSGDSVELTCRVVGDPIPHFFWRHNDEIVETDEYHRIRSLDNTSTLKILSVEPKDRGVYICSAVNELGKSQTTANVTVDGVVEPYEEFETDVGKYRPLRHGVPRIAPDGLMLESSTPTDLTICWSPVISEDGSDLSYTVEMSKDNGYFWSPVLTNLQTNRAVLPHTIASPLQPIQLRVLAENALGTGPPSQPVLKIPARVSVPNMATVKPMIAKADLGSVMITWTDPPGSRDGNISYIVEVREGTRSDWKPIASGLKDKAYVHHLKPGVSTMVRIRAYNGFGTSEPSATAIANLPVEHLIPDLAVDPPWVSVIRPDINFSEKSAHAGLMLHWKEAYLPEYCDACVRGLRPIYTVEWRKGRTGPWSVIDDCISDTTSYKLPSYVYRAVQDASNYSSQTPEIRVVCRNDYGSTLATKSLRLTDFGLPKQNDLDSAKPLRQEESLFTLPIISLPQGSEKRPIWLTSMDIENGISLKWEESLHTSDGSPHGKYRMEYAIIPNSRITDPEGWWKPIGPGSQPILGDSYCLDLSLSSTSEQYIRLLGLTNDGMISGWLNGYRQVRIPSKRQLLPSAVESLRARVHQPKNKGGNYSVRLDWSPCGQTEGEQILSEQLERGLYFQPMETTYRIEAQEGHGVWREIGSVLGSSKTFFEHKTPLSGSTLRYRVIPINRYGEGPAVEAPAIQIPKKLTDLQECVEDLKALIIAPQSVFLRWRLGDEAIDALESTCSRVPSTSDSPSRMGDSGYEDTDWRGAVRYCVERRDGFSSDWYPVATVDSIQDELTGKVTLKNCPKEMYGNEYRVIALLNGQPCAPSRPVRINIKSAELAPDLSYQKVHVDVNKVDEYLISYPEEKLEAFFSNHILASTFPQSLEEGLTFDVEAMIGNSKEWKKIATGLSSPSFAWGEVNPLIPYSFRIVGRNQFGAGLPSRTTHVDAQVVIPDLSFVVPIVREPTGILEGREPPELKWQTPRVYSLTQTLTPFTYEVQVRHIGGGSSSDDWKVFKEGLKQPKCTLEGLDPTQEYALRVVAVTNFGRGEPSQQTRKRRSRAGRASRSLSNYGSSNSSYDSIPPQFENPSTELIYVPTGGDLDLRCTLSSYNLKNPVQFIWSFNSQEIPNLPKHEQFPSGYFQHVTGGGKSAQLRLFDLDERDFGTYTCKAVNAYGSVDKEFRVVRADAPVITEVPMPIITLPVHYTLLLPCCVDAVPPAKITWTRDSKRLTSSYRTWIGGETGASGQSDWSADEDEMELGELTVDASLRVERCVFQDAGLYTMIAENPAGRAQTSCIVRIEGEIPISIINLFHVIHL